MSHFCLAFLGPLCINSSVIMHLCGSLNLSYLELIELLEYVDLFLSSALGLGPLKISKSRFRVAFFFSMCFVVKLCSFGKVDSDSYCYFVSVGRRKLELLALPFC